MSPLMIVERADMMIVERADRLIAKNEQSAAAGASLSSGRGLG